MCRVSSEVTSLPLILCSGDSHAGSGPSQAAADRGSKTSLSLLPPSLLSLFFPSLLMVLSSFTSTGLAAFPDLKRPPLAARATGKASLGSGADVLEISGASCSGLGLEVGGEASVLKSSSSLAIWTAASMNGSKGPLSIATLSGAQATAQQMNCSNCHGSDAWGSGFRCPLALQKRVQSSPRPAERRCSL